MKKSKSEIALEAFKLFLDYLDRHNVQGRIIAFGFAASFFCFSAFLLFFFLVKNCEKLILIIDALK